MGLLARRVLAAGLFATGTILAVVAYTTWATSSTAGLWLALVSTASIMLAVLLLNRPPPVRIVPRTLHRATR